MAEEKIKPDEEVKELAEGERVSKGYAPSKADIFDDLLNEEQAEEDIEEVEVVEQEKELEKIGEKEEKKVEREYKKKKKQKIKVVNAAGKQEEEKEEATKEDIDSEAAELDREEQELIGKEENEREEVEKGVEEEGTKEEPPEREEIKNTILEKAEIASEHDKKPKTSTIQLKFLEDEEKKNVFIGRKKGVYKKYGYDGALFVGRVNEEECKENNVFMDSLNPHVVFVCGARGSGKSYVLGVMAEELALKNKNVGIIVIDPIGVFWSMRFPNKEEREIKALAKWGLTPEGLKNLKVFIPEGIKKEVPKTTYDGGFAMQPSLLTAEDWCLTFGIERFSPTGLLVDKVLKKVEKGYKQAENGKNVKGKDKKYSIEDIIVCLETDAELNSRERGYKQDSIRALASRFDAAKNWGIFSEKGTPLSELSMESQLTVLDTSFLEDNVTALVIGILARRVLAARKISTRKEAASKFKSIDVDELLELEIPPTWLFIDEAHTLIPSGTEKTPATNGLVEYVKQGRRPGCSLVFATQQPSAIDTKVLSQLDLMICHKLIFDDDIKAVYRRMPTIVPMNYKRGNFIKTLPIGVALVGDRREETSRAFVMGIRPRMSQHEGRDAETVGMSRTLNPKQVEVLATELALNDLQKGEDLEIEKIDKALVALNSKYKSSGKLAGVLEKLEKKGFKITEEKVIAMEEKEPEKEEPTIGEVSEGLVKEEGLPQETIELLALPIKVSEKGAGEIINKVRKKKLLGVFGKEEEIKEIGLKYYTIWKVKYDVYTRKNEFIRREVFIDSISGEFLHFSDGVFVKSKGLNLFYELSPEDIKILRLLMKNELLVEEIMNKTEFGEGKVRRILQKLIEKQLVGAIVEKKTNKKMYWVKERLDLPPSERHELLQSLNNLPFVRADVVNKEREVYGKELIPELLGKLWENVVVKDIGEIYKPVWEATLILEGKERKVSVDAVTGKVI